MPGENRNYVWLRQSAHPHMAPFPLCNPDVLESLYRRLSQKRLAPTLYEVRRYARNIWAAWILPFRAVALAASHRQLEIYLVFIAIGAPFIFEGGRRAPAYFPKKHLVGRGARGKSSTRYFR